MQQTPAQTPGQPGAQTPGQSPAQTPGQSPAQTPGQPPVPLSASVPEQPLVLQEPPANQPSENQPTENQPPADQQPSIQPSEQPPQPLALLTPPGGAAGQDVASAAPTLSAPADCARASAASPPTADGFKREVACRIHARNGGHLYEGAPPPVLRSVVVLSVRIDAKGKPVRIGVVRSNGIRELERRAIQSVRQAAPLPLPGALALRQGTMEITETWLFNDAGNFQVRTLAAVQAKSGY